MEKKIRLAKVKDIKKMLEIYRPHIEHSAVSFEFEVPTVAEFKKRVQKNLKKLPWLVCEIDGVVAGYAYACEHRSRKAYQWSVESSVYIDKNFHGIGVGKALYQKLFEVLKEQGVYNVYAGITYPHPASAALHESMGFEKIGIYKNVGYKQGGWHDVLWYQLALRSDGIPGNLLPLRKIKSLD